MYLPVLIMGCSKDPFLNPSYMLLGFIPMDNIPLFRMPIGLFNEFTHRLTSPQVKTSQYIPFVETCFGSQLPFGLGIPAVRSLLQPYPLHYRGAFAFSYILCPLSHPRSCVRDTTIFRGTRRVYQVSYVRLSSEPLGRRFPPVALRTTKERKKTVPTRQHTLLVSA